MNRDILRHPPGCYADLTHCQIDQLFLASTQNCFNRKTSVQKVGEEVYLERLIKVPTKMLRMTDFEDIA